MLIWHLWLLCQTLPTASLLIEFCSNVHVFLWTLSMLKKFEFLDLGCTFLQFQILIHPIDFVILFILFILFIFQCEWEHCSQINGCYYLWLLWGDYFIDSSATLGLLTLISCNCSALFTCLELSRSCQADNMQISGTQ